MFSTMDLNYVTRWRSSSIASESLYEMEKKRLSIENDALKFLFRPYRPTYLPWVTFILPRVDV